jgi:hypothetical protein
LRMGLGLTGEILTTSSILSSLFVSMFRVL